MGTAQGSDSSNPKETSEHQNDKLKKLPGSMADEMEASDPKTPLPPAEDGKKGHNGGASDPYRTPEKKPSSSARKGKKTASIAKGSRYPLRSSSTSARVLRSRSNKENKTPPPASTPNPEHLAKKKRRRRKLKGTANDEFSRIRHRIRYHLARMSYEQSLIDAYANEGWKGQSLEKIRPEKELERAKSQIIGCKLKIRDLFQHLHSLIAEGRLEETLFDSEGEIESEDIFCAKCGSKDVSANNDIILCDGICDRGFHQKCLTPPLLNEDIPSGDEGWLCPGCDCKVDCIDLINELQGTDLSVEDGWEKVFPEAAAASVGNKIFDDLGLPSEDSEDEDYAPGGPKVHADADADNDEGSSSDDNSEGSSADHSDEGSSSDELGFTSESGVRKDEMLNGNFGLPSDDSEDDDFDPDMPDTKVKSQGDGSSSDGSDFTSDTDDLDALGDNECSISSPEFHALTGEAKIANCRNKSSLSAELLLLKESELDQGNIVLASGKRKLERLDYKKLHDETYGDDSSDSSEDETWTDSNPKKIKNIFTEKGSSNKRSQTAKKTRSSKSIKASPGEDVELDPELDQPNCSSELATEGNLRRTCRQLLSDGVDHFAVSQAKKSSDCNSGRKKSSKTADSLACNSRSNKPGSSKVVKDGSKKRNPERLQIPKDRSDLNSSGKDAVDSAKRFFGREISQKLQESFEENQYPSRDTKKNLTQELGITLSQVNKWFENARHHFRVSAKENNQAGSSSGKHTSPTKPGRKIVSSCKYNIPGSHGADDSQNIVVGISGEKGRVTAGQNESDPKESPVNGHIMGDTRYEAPHTEPGIKVENKLNEVTAEHTSIDSQKSPVSGGRKVPKQRSLNIDVAMIESPVTRRGKSKEVAGESSDRQKLVLRELRKRGKAK